MEWSNKELGVINEVGDLIESHRWIEAYDKICELAYPNMARKIFGGLVEIVGVDTILKRIKFVPSVMLDFSPSITKLTIPNNIIDLYGGAFRGCNIEELSFESGGKLVFIDEYAFAKNKLKKVILPDGLECLGDGAFCDNPDLVYIKIPDSLKRIGYHIFKNCSNLKIEYRGKIISEKEFYEIFKKNGGHQVWNWGLEFIDRPRP